MAAKAALAATKTSNESSPNRGLDAEAADVRVLTAVLVVAHSLCPRPPRFPAASQLLTLRSGLRAWLVRHVNYPLAFLADKASDPFLRDLQEGSPLLCLVISLVIRPLQDERLDPGTHAHRPQLRAGRLNVLGYLRTGGLKWLDLLRVAPLVAQSLLRRHERLQ